MEKSNQEQKLEKKIRHFRIEDEYWKNFLKKCGRGKASDVLRKLIQEYLAR